MLAWWCSPKDLMILVDVTVLPLIRGSLIDKVFNPSGYVHVQIQGKRSKISTSREVRARTLFVLSSSNRGRLLGFIDLMRQKNKRMKQEGLIKHYGILQKMEDSTRYDKEGNKINIEDLLKKIKTKLMLIEDKLQLGD
ncbi:hypothetical protein Tco_0040197 [Tanacetum coccineum]